MKIAVIGGGLAGLSAGCELAGAGCDVTVLERRPWAGGKTYSFTERETGERIDNGQHILMRCTTEHIAFLRRIGSDHLIHWQPRLRVPVFDAKGRRSALAAAALPPPLHLAPSFAAYRHLSLADKARVVRAFAALHRAREDDQGIDGLTFGDWLRKHSQSRRAIKSFWDLIMIPALNCRCDDASAGQALFVFRVGFLKSAQSAAIGIPMVGLSELQVEPAIKYIEDRGGFVRTGRSVESIEIDASAVRGVTVAGGEHIEADAYVMALPPVQLLELLPAPLRSRAPFDALASMRTSPIVNMHLWFDAPVTDLPFAAFTGCDLQWMFAPPAADGRFGRHVVLSLSAADRYIHLDRRELVSLLLPQWRRALPAASARALVRAVVIKEPDATFVPAPDLQRPGPSTPIGRLFLAGAYTATGWPATMESAVRSGIAAARAALGSEVEFERALAPSQRDPVRAWSMA